MAEITREQALDLFNKAMKAKHRQKTYVPDDKVKNHQYLKDQILLYVKRLFESLDNVDPEMVTNSAVDISNVAFFISESLGRIDVFGTKIIEYSGK